MEINTMNMSCGHLIVHDLYSSLMMNLKKKYFRNGQEQYIKNKED